LIVILALVGVAGVVLATWPLFFPEAPKPPAKQPTQQVATTTLPTATLQKLEEDLADARKNWTAWEKYAGELKGNLAISNEELEAANKRIADFKKKEKSSSELMGQIKARDEQLGLKDSELTRLKNERDELKGNLTSVSTELAGLRKQLGEAQKASEKAAAERDQLNGQLAKAKAETQEASKNATAQLNARDAQLATLTKERDELKVKLASAISADDEKIGAFLKQVQERDAQLATLRKQLSEEKAETEKKMAELAKDKAALQDAVKVAQAKAATPPVASAPVAAPPAAPIAAPAVAAAPATPAPAPAALPVRQETVSVVVEFRKGGPSGPPVPNARVDIYFRGIAGQQDLALPTGSDGQTLTLEVPFPATGSIRLVGPAGFAYVRPHIGNAIVVNGAELDPAKGINRVLFITK
jgi:predicted  nucleic acid-binding Zn-ribbon protein